MVTKKDVVWHLGDVAWGKPALLKALPRLNGIKKLVMGNHDHYSTQTYLDVGFSKLYGIAQLKTGEVLSHVPLHPTQLQERWTLNIHGHLHSRVVDGILYRNVSCERINFTPISYEELRV